MNKVIPNQLSIFQIQGEPKMNKNNSKEQPKDSLHRFDQNSILNTYGTYGSKYSNTSIFNQYCLFGGKYSQFSPFNQYTNTPPRIFREKQCISWLTVNKYCS